MASPGPTSELSDQFVAVSRVAAQKGQVYTETAAARNFFGTRTVDSCCHYFKHHIRPDMKILDIGCGPGTITTGLAQLVPQGEVTAVDVSESSLDHAKALGESMGLSNVKFLLADAHDLSQLKDSSFDIVHTHLCLCHLSDAAKVMVEFHRLTKPNGGFVACRDLVNWEIFPSSEPIKRGMDLARKNWAKKGNPDAGVKMQFWAHDAGFPWEKIEWTGGTESAFGCDERQKILGVVRGWKMHDAPNAGEAGVRREQEEEEQAWKEWAARDGAGAVFTHGQMIAWK